MLMASFSCCCCCCFLQDAAAEAPADPAAAATELTLAAGLGSLASHPTLGGRLSTIPEVQHEALTEAQQDAAAAAAHHDLAAAVGEGDGGEDLLGLLPDEAGAAAAPEAGSAPQQQQQGEEQQVLDEAQQPQEHLHGGDAAGKAGDGAGSSLPTSEVRLAKGCRGVWQCTWRGGGRGGLGWHFCMPRRVLR
jgi:hypothetical protein